jgi:hypothetical protein
MRRKAFEDITSEISTLFGPAPILSTEREESYFAIMDWFVRCIAPEDILLYSLVRELVDSTWEMKRYTRYKTMAIESKFRQLCEQQAKCKARIADRNKALARDAAAKSKPPANEFERVLELEEVVDASISEVDDILSRTPEELDHVRALQANIEYHQQIDMCLEAAIARRNDALGQIERYRKGLAARLREVSDQHVQSDDRDEESAPSLVP